MVFSCDFLTPTKVVSLCGENNPPTPRSSQTLPIDAFHSSDEPRCFRTAMLRPWGYPNQTQVFFQMKNNLQSKFWLTIICHHLRKSLSQILKKKKKKKKVIHKDDFKTSMILKQKLFKNSSKYAEPSWYFVVLPSGISLKTFLNCFSYKGLQHTTSAIKLK